MYFDPRGPGASLTNLTLEPLRFMRRVSPGKTVLILTKMLLYLCRRRKNKSRRGYRVKLFFRKVWHFLKRSVLYCFCCCSPEKYQHQYVQLKNMKPTSSEESSLSAIETAPHTSKGRKIRSKRPLRKTEITTENETSIDQPTVAESDTSSTSSYDLQKPVRESTSINKAIGPSTGLSKSESNRRTAPFPSCGKPPVVDVKSTVNQGQYDHDSMHKPHHHPECSHPRIQQGGIHIIVPTNAQVTTKSCGDLLPPSASSSQTSFGYDSVETMSLGSNPIPESTVG